MTDSNYRLIFAPMLIDGVITIDAVDYNGVTHSLIYPSWEEAEADWKKMKKGEDIEN